MKRLAGGKPRRYRDHRRKEAKRWGEDYAAVAERYPPRDRLARELIALAADMLGDYEALRLSRRATASARRKAASRLEEALEEAREALTEGKRETR